MSSGRGRGRGRGRGGPQKTKLGSVVDNNFFKGLKDKDWRKRSELLDKLIKTLENGELVIDVDINRKLTAELVNRFEDANVKVLQAAGAAVIKLCEFGEDFSRGAKVALERVIPLYKEKKQQVLNMWRDVSDACLSCFSLSDERACQLVWTCGLQSKLPVVRMETLQFVIRNVGPLDADEAADVANRLSLALIPMVEQANGEDRNESMAASQVLFQLLLKVGETGRPFRTFSDGLLARIKLDASVNVPVADIMMPPAAQNRPKVDPREMTPQARRVMNDSSMRSNVASMRRARKASTSSTSSSASSSSTSSRPPRGRRPTTSSARSAASSNNRGRGGRGGGVGVGGGVGGGGVVKVSEKKMLEYVKTFQALSRGANEVSAETLAKEYGLPPRAATNMRQQYGQSLDVQSYTAWMESRDSSKQKRVSITVRPRTAARRQAPKANDTKQAVAGGKKAAGGSARKESNRSLAEVHDEMRTIFEQVDVDGSGTISIEELAKMLHISVARATDLMMIGDQDDSGELDFEEFVELMQNPTALLSHRAEESHSIPDHLVKEYETIFKAVDQNGNGTVSIEEMSAGLGLSTQHVEKLWERLNIGHTSELTFVQFVQLMTETDLEAAPAAASSENVDKFDDEDLERPVKIDGADTSQLRADYRLIFDEMDKNDDGCVEPAELARVLNVEVDQAMSIMEVGDTDGDGKLDFEEFFKLMLATSDQQVDKMMNKGTPRSDRYYAILHTRVRQLVEKRASNLRYHDMTMKRHQQIEARRASGMPQLGDEDQSYGLQKMSSINRKREKALRDSRSKIREEEEEVAVTLPGLQQKAYDMYKQLFSEMDTDGNGVIDAEELSRGLQVEADKCAKIIRQNDIDGDGQLDLREFINLMQKL